MSANQNGPETDSQEDQKIWVLNGVENILNFYIERYTIVRMNIAVCEDYLGPIAIKKTKPLWRANLELDILFIQYWNMKIKCCHTYNLMLN